MYFPCQRPFSLVLLWLYLFTGCIHPHEPILLPAAAPDSPKVILHHVSPGSVPFLTEEGIQLSEAQGKWWADLRVDSSVGGKRTVPVSFGVFFSPANLEQSDQSWQKKYVHLLPKEAGATEPGSLYIGIKPLKKTSRAAHSPPGAAGAEQAVPQCLGPITVQGGYQVSFQQVNGKWQARVTEKIGCLSRTVSLPVVPKQLSEATLLKLLDSSPTSPQKPIQVAFPEQTFDQQGYVYVGKLGLLGGIAADHDGAGGSDHDGAGGSDHEEAGGSDHEEAGGSDHDGTGGSDHDGAGGSDHDGAGGSDHEEAGGSDHDGVESSDRTGHEAGEPIDRASVSEDSQQPKSIADQIQAIQDLSAATIPSLKQDTPSPAPRVQDKSHSEVIETNKHEVVTIRPSSTSPLAPSEDNLQSQPKSLAAESEDLPAATVPSLKQDTPSPVIDKEVADTTDKDSDLAASIPTSSSANQPSQIESLLEESSQGGVADHKELSTQPKHTFFGPLPTNQADMIPSLKAQQERFDHWAQDKVEEARTMSDAFHLQQHGLLPMDTHSKRSYAQRKLDAEIYAMGTRSSRVPTKGVSVGATDRVDGYKGGGQDQPSGSSRGSGPSSEPANQPDSQPSFWKKCKDYFFKAPERPSNQKSEQQASSVNDLLKRAQELKHASPSEACIADLLAEIKDKEKDLEAAYRLNNQLYVLGDNAEVLEVHLIKEDDRLQDQLRTLESVRTEVEDLKQATATVAQPPSVNALAAEAEAIVQALQQAPDSLALEAEGKSLLATIEALEQQLESRLVAIDREQAASKQSVTAMNREEIKWEIRKLKDEYRDNNRLFLGGDNSAILDRHLLARNQFLKQELIRLRAIRDSLDKADNDESDGYSSPDDNYYSQQEVTNRTEFVKGVGDAVVDTVEGICNTLVQLAEDPSVVIGDLINAVKAIPELPEKLKAYLSDVEVMNEEEQARELGKFTGNVAMLLASCSFKTKGTPAGKTPARGAVKVKQAGADKIGKGASAAQGAEMSAKQVKGVTQQSWKASRWNIGEAAVNKKHHNWHKIFGDSKPTLDQIKPYVKEALKKGEWKKVDVLRNKSREIIGDKVKLIYSDHEIWVLGKKSITGEITINNAGVI